jgi:hypothetical protein
MEDKLEKHIKIGYKVTNNASGSWTITPREIGYRKYKLKETTYPNINCGPLAIFDTLENAKVYLLKGWDHIQKYGYNSYFNFGKIYKCKYRVSENDTFWMGERQSFHFTPEGTMYADWITLLQEIPKDQIVKRNK